MEEKPPIEDVIRDVLNGFAQIIENGLHVVQEQTDYDFKFCLVVYDANGEARAMTKSAETKLLLEHLRFYENRIANPDYQRNEALIRMAPPTRAIN